MMRLIVDRIEDGRAVLETENGERIDIAQKELPQGAKEGEVLEEQGGALVLVPEETKGRRESMRNLLRELIEEKKG